MLRFAHDGESLLREPRHDVLGGLGGHDDADPGRHGKSRNGFGNRGQVGQKRDSLRLGDGAVVFLNDEEAKAATNTNAAVINRAWDLWKAMADSAAPRP